MPPEKKGSILVVDDNPVTLYATNRVLKHAGFDVQQASTGNQGIEIASQHPIDLVVLDIDLPDIDGYEVCRRIRARPSTTRMRVVYLSASFVADADKVAGFEAGADGFLTHPTEPAVLIATVSALLRTRAIEMELEQLLERERLAREDAERANRAKDDFLATLSHELRSPLTAIVGWSAVARLKAEGRPEVLDALNVIARNARLQAQLISDLLDVSRITTGNHIRVELSPISLAEVVQSNVESAMGAAQERGVVLHADIESDMAPVLGDSGRLDQVIANLLSNAIKFSQPGGRVEVSLSSSGDTATISVTDHGRGIRRAALPRIFDRFWQEDTSTRRSHGGLGLGLSIAKHLTELHGGTLTASSDGEGHGATFSLNLPLAPDAAHPTRASDGNYLDTDASINLKELRVLVVDDDGDGRLWVRHILTAAGAETLDVSSVNEALAAVESFAPDVIVTDLAMPRRNGFDLVHSLRAGGHTATTLPVIALSALASIDDEQRALNADFQYFMAKPPEPRDLLRLVWRATH